MRAGLRASLAARFDLSWLCNDLLHEG